MEWIVWNAQGIVPGVGWVFANFYIYEEWRGYRDRGLFILYNWSIQRGAGGGNMEMTGT